MHFVKFANKITRNNFLDCKYVRAVKFYKTPYCTLLRDCTLNNIFYLKINKNKIKYKLHTSFHGT